MDIKTESNANANLRANVRFNEEEYVRLQKDAFLLGKTIPILLKEVYFKGPQVNPLMNVEDQRATLAELRRIGNNINQIAKHLNSGFRNGCDREFKEICENLSTLRKFVVGIYGVS